ncbi:hypothetical protein ACFWA9_34245 [Kitasatospora sp. NPDC059973]|uniref:hypothetical protein n=1 Tax=Kitasatospora sp. NPDC059973 TaxID=3347020 RepID=UPI0036BF7AA5
MVTALAKAGKTTLVRQDGTTDPDPVDGTSRFAAELRPRARAFVAHGRVGANGVQESPGGEDVVTGGTRQRGRLLARRCREAARVYAHRTTEGQPGPGPVGPGRGGGPVGHHR